MSWGSGASVTKLRAGEPVSFFVDTTGLKKGHYALRVTIVAPGGTAQSIGAALSLRVS